MKRFLAVIFSAVVLTASAFTITGCGCSNNNETSPEPATDVVGEWGGRSDDVEAEFNDDGTCIIGGVTGTYEIDENNTLTVTPNSNGETNSEPLVFEYYSNSDTSSIQQNQWTIVDDKLYINGHQYNSNTTDSSSSSNTTDSSANNQNSSSANNSSSSATTSSGVTDNSSSSSSSNSSNNSSSNSSSSSTSSNSSSSNSSSSSSTSSDTEIEIIQNGEEEEIINIVEELDFF